MTSKLVAMTLCAVLAVAMAPPGQAAEGAVARRGVGADAGERAPGKHPKLDGPTAEVAAASARSSKAAVAAARDQGLAIRGAKVALTVTAAKGQARAARAAVRRLGGHIRHGDTAGREIGADLPAEAVAALAADASVDYAGRPLESVPQAVAGQGVRATGAKAWHRRGWRGRSAKVAVIDNGFAGWRQARANGDLPARPVRKSFCPNGLENGGQRHGTGVAEIVHEMAPRARLYLICSSGGVASFRNAMEYAYRQGVRVVNFSVAVPPVSRGDGNTASMSTYEGVVRKAQRRGMLLVASAGNYGQVHWSGGTVDANNNFWLEFGGGDELNDFILGPRQTAWIWLKWDEWPVTSNDYDLFLYQGATEVAKSATQQSAQAPRAPVETIVYTNPTNQTLQYSVGIQRYLAAPTARFDLYVYGPPQLERRVRRSSVIDPAAFPHTFAVGAACVFDRTLADYSAWGPSVAGVRKPDIAAPYSARSFSYGDSQRCGSGFTGTSAASPHVAGAAALWLQLYPRLSVARLRATLERYAAPDGAPGKDNRFGAGHLRMPRPS